MNNEIKFHTRNCALLFRKNAEYESNTYKLAIRVILKCNEKLIQNVRQMNFSNFQSEYIR